MDAIVEKVMANDMLINNEISGDVSPTPKVAYRRPLIIQYRGFSIEIFLQNSGSISIDQNTPPNIERGINTNVVNIPI